MNLFKNQVEWYNQRTRKINAILYEIDKLKGPEKIRYSFTVNCTELIKAIEILKKAFSALREGKYTTVEL